MFWREKPLKRFGGVFRSQTTWLKPGANGKEKFPANQQAQKYFKGYYAVAILFKVLQADRLLALSQNGLTIVVYCALIASLLVVLWTGKKPTKRTFELLCFYFSGWISDAELLAHLARLEAADSNK